MKYEERKRRGEREGRKNKERIYIKHNCTKDKERERDNCTEKEGKKRDTTERHN